MRNDLTDTLGERLTVAFKKSGLAVREFIDHLVDVRSNTIIESSDEGFHALIDGDVFHFYHGRGRWFCKL